MIIGVMSDTHGNVKYMHAVAGQMRDAHAVELIYHLGDNYPDAEQLGYAGLANRIIPGLWCREYRDGSAPKTLFDSHGGWTLSCAHADHDLSPAERAADIVMHGHTHIAYVENRGGHLWLNPGHLKARRDREQDASYIVLELSATALLARIHEFDGAVRAEHSFDRAHIGSGASQHGE